MNTRVKIRGIYSTALTKLALDWDYSVVGPSVRICERFGLEPNEEPCDILIQDREDMQGVELSGEAEQLCQFLTFLQERLPDVILVHFDTMDEAEGLMKAVTEFPGGTKEILDELRLFVAPTVARHHRMRIIDAKLLEQAEATLCLNPECKESLADKLFFQTILLPLEKSGIVRVEHIRPSGKAMRPREGALIEASGHRVVFKRTFSSGRYDGLDIDIKPGDYGLTEVIEGSWHIKHAYFTKEGNLIGEYFNINTPVELYPYGARYVDLEVDVIQRAGQPPFMIDREKLAFLHKQGAISAGLEGRALDVAEQLMRTIRK